ncbi:lycopene cyclase domain-containing protein [Cuniculiplasma sp. SKW4]|uniref:lycopene cyclase domain-containing protein n=1 Tax=Cuniculiplasma sp. SKW4 TaxID=3400171 RepID=UPI003FD14CEB
MISFPVYLMIDIFTFGGPLFISIVGKVKFLEHYKATVTSIVTVAIPYIIWDMLVTGVDWHFNPKYVLPIKIVDLPIEEILFFFVVPFAMLFVFEYIREYSRERTVDGSSVLYASSIAFVIIIILTFLSYSIQYLFLALISLDVLFVSQFLSNFNLFRSKNYWLYMLTGVIAFLIVNYILTSLPVVEYYTSRILTTSSWNGRITTIPMEDFIYNFSLLSFYLFFYRMYEKYF